MSDNKKEAQFDPAFPLPDEAEETVYAIRRGAVDAVVVEEPEGHRVYTLTSADLPYSVLVERMQQGAAILNEHGEILSCNSNLADLLGAPRSELLGKPLRDFLSESDWDASQRLLSEVHSDPAEGEVQLRRLDGSPLPASLSFLSLTRDNSTIGLLVTDLTAQKEREEFSARLQRVQDEERRHIARELHDSVGQLLAGLSMNLGSILADAHKMGPESSRAVEDSVALVDSISKEIRTVSYMLHPPLLELAGLASALQWYVDTFAERSKIRAEMEIPSDLPRLSDDVEIAVFRMVQECLTNVHRHSGSKSCSLKLVIDGARLRIELRDSGRGIPADRWDAGKNRVRSAGLGLRGMRERFRQLGGTLDVQTGEDGTTITATLPLPAAGAETLPRQDRSA